MQKITVLWYRMLPNHFIGIISTIHPFMGYFDDRSDEADVASVNHISFVVSESNIHDTVSVHLFQKLLIVSLTTEITKPKRIILFLGWLCSTV